MPWYVHAISSIVYAIPHQFNFRSPTRAFPHPLTRIAQTEIAKGTLNYCSYAIAENLTWTGS